MMIFVCLGNSGKKYSKTRHNVGRMFGDFVTQKSEIKCQKSKVKIGKIFELENGWKVVTPECFMNQSGSAVQKLLKIKNCLSASGGKIENLVVVHDDLDIPFGEFKIQFGRGAAGHHGVESVIESLSTDQFWRIRIGIGKSPQNVEPEKWVLMPFEKEEQSKLEEIFERVYQEIKRKTDPESSSG